MFLRTLMIVCSILFITWSDEGVIKNIEFNLGGGYLRGIVGDSNGNIFVSAGNRVLKLEPSGDTTVIISGLSNATDLVLDEVNNILYVLETSRVVKFHIESDRTFQVRFFYRDDKGRPAEYTFSYALSMGIDSRGDVFVAADGFIYQGSYTHPAGRYLPEGHFYTSRVFAGTGVVGHSGNGGLATEAQIDPIHSGLAIDGDGNVFFSETLYIRKVDRLTGITSNFAGNGLRGRVGNEGDGGLATDASIYYTDIAFDRNNNLYLSQYFDGIIRKISANNNVIEKLVGEGVNYPVNASVSAFPMFIDKYDQIYFITGTREPWNGNSLKKIDFRYPQALSLDPINEIIYGDSVFLTTEGLKVNPIIYSSETISVCEISGSTCYSKSAGECIVSAMQYGDFNFRDTIISQAFNVSQKELTIDIIGPIEKIYDGATSILISNVTLNGVIAGDDVSLKLGDVNFISKDIGTNKSLNISLSTLNGTSSGNYSFTEPNYLVGDIHPKEVTINFTEPFQKTYDGTTSLLEPHSVLVGVLPNEELDLDAGPIYFSDPKIGFDKELNFAWIFLTGNNAGNYSIVPLDGLTGNILPNTSSLLAYGLPDNFKGHYTIYNLSGNKVRSGYSNPSSNSLGIETSELVKGYYYVQFESSSFLYYHNF